MGCLLYTSYANASKYAKQALAENTKLKELILEAGLISKEKLDEVLNAREMTRPGIPGMRRHKRKKEDK